MLKKVANVLNHYSKLETRILSNLIIKSTIVMTNLISKSIGTNQEFENFSEEFVDRLAFNTETTCLMIDKHKDSIFARQLIFIDIMKAFRETYKMNLFLELHEDPEFTREMYLNQ